MTRYRVYSLNSANKVCRPPDVFDCCDDELAIKKAKDLIDELSVEIWDGARLVTRIDAPPKEEARTQHDMQTMLKWPFTGSQPASISFATERFCSP